MKSVCLLALPLSLITTGASGVTYGSPETFIGNFKIEAPGPGSKLTVDYPDGFGAMKLSAGEVMTDEMLQASGGSFLSNTAKPASFTFQTGVLNSDFTFNTTGVVSAGTFKFPLYVHKNYVKTGKSVDFQAALLKTSFAPGSSLSGKTAVLTFDVPSENRRGGKSLVIVSVATNGVGMILSKSDDSTKKLGFYFKMLCAKHPTASPSTKGTSAACTSSEFKPYNSAARNGNYINRYEMSLLGSSASPNYYHNTIAFVPYYMSSVTSPVGSYTGDLTVTFGVE